MKFHLTDDGGANIITALDDHSFSIGGRRVEGGLLLTPQSIVQPWPPASPRAPDDLTAPLRAAVQEGLAVMLLGLGATAPQPPQEWLALFGEKQIGLEVMDTRAAARTYNILAGEGRAVCAGLLTAGFVFGG